MKNSEKKSLIMRIIVLSVVAVMVIGIVAAAVYQGAAGSM